MPEMTGPDLAQRFSALRTGTAVVFMSAHAEEALVGRGVLPPRTAFLEKPFTPTALNEKLRSALTWQDVSVRSGSRRPGAIPG
jgi:two-component system, cell cycle sensor histidine kinase and response regulator CckA